MAKLPKVRKSGIAAFVILQSALKLLNDNKELRQVASDAGGKAAGKVGEIRAGRSIQARMNTQLDVAYEYATGELTQSSDFVDADRRAAWLERIERLRQRVKLASVGKTGSSRRKTLRQLSIQINALLDEMLEFDEKRPTNFNPYTD